MPARKYVSFLRLRVSRSINSLSFLLLPAPSLLVLLCKMWASHSARHFSGKHGDWNRFDIWKSLSSISLKNNQIETLEKNYTCHALTVVYRVMGKLSPKLSIFCTERSKKLHVCDMFFLANYINRFSKNIHDLGILTAMYQSSFVNGPWKIIQKLVYAKQHCCNWNYKTTE